MIAYPRTFNTCGTVGRPHSGCYVDANDPCGICRSSLGGPTTSSPPLDSIWGRFSRAVKVIFQRTLSMLCHILANTANGNSDVRRVKYDCNDDKIQKGQNKSFWQVGNGRQLCLKCAERRELVGQQMIGEKHFFAALLLATILFAICPNTCGHACWVQGCSISIFPQTQICFSIVGDSSSNIEFHIAIICRSHVHVQLCALCT